MGILVVKPGALTLVEDLGRPGHAAMGLSPSGALDRASLMLANSLLGNPVGTAGLEVLMGGLVLRFVTASAVAVTGAEGLVRLNGTEMPLNKGVRVAPGSVLEFGTPFFGLRYYVAIQGGLEAPVLLGSRSTDVLSGEGPAPLKAGDTLIPGRSGMGVGNSNVYTSSFPVIRRAPDPERPITLRIDEGPRADWFAPGAWQRLIGQHWTLSPDSNRIGARLQGRPLVVDRAEELASEGMVKGALQVPPSGLPTVFLADHPVTGGYPVIGVVRQADLDLLGQARPGQEIRFLG
ncbi:biotin-dependent carboxyltransferase family protein [Arthrobacter sp. M4]|uniref:5-oxoprolinase subunit C family protein n=1 Tax=Arthrobacter sp. M4 TaxID=218160 RepID=UPI001CDD882E|nr:biotin-dependent carboxyltransferase family protein [Arthrobacter sp. M4]MCA4134158.1 biotin-dependent carboxyltransferase family protein [Arthrobacter sp. M4]